MSKGSFLTYAISHLKSRTLLSVPSWPSEQACFLREEGFLSGGHSYVSVNIATGKWLSNKCLAWTIHKVQQNKRSHLVLGTKLDDYSSCILLREEMWWQRESSFLRGSGSGAFDNMTMFDPQDNVTLSCAARNIQGPVQLPYNATVVISLRVCQSLLLFLASFSGIFLNVLVVILVAKYKKLRTISFGIAVQISVLDILSSANFTIAIVNVMANRWLFGEHMCGILGASIFFAGTARTAVLFVFVVNRFFLVFLPFAYPKFQKRVVLILSIASWVLFVIAMVTEYVLDCFEFRPNSWLCINSKTCNGNCTALDVILIVLLSPAAIIPVVFYSALFFKAKKAQKALALAGEKKPYDWKATITFFLMFLTSFALTLPNFLIAFVTNLVYREEQVPLFAFVFTVISSRLLSFVPAADAIVILRNPDVREIIGEITKKIVNKKRGRSN